MSLSGFLFFKKKRTQGESRPKRKKKYYAILFKINYGSQASREPVDFRIFRLFKKKHMKIAVGIEPDNSHLLNLNPPFREGEV